MVVSHAWLIANDAGGRIGEAGVRCVSDGLFDAAPSRDPSPTRRRPRTPTRLPPRFNCLLDQPYLEWGTKSCLNSSGYGLPTQ